MLKKIVFDTNEETYIIENGKVQHYTKPVMHVEEGQAIIRPSFAVLYYEEDDQGCCREISQREYEQAQNVNEVCESVEFEIVQQLPPPLKNYGLLPSDSVAQNQFYCPTANVVTNPFTSITYPAYQSQLTQQNLFAISQKIIKSSQSDEDEDGDAGDSIERNFSLQLVVRHNYISTTLDDCNITTTLVFVIYYPGGEVTKEIEGYKATETKWIAEATSYKAYLRPGKKSTQSFIQYVQTLMADNSVAEDYIFLTSGWKCFGNDHGYLHADGVIGVDIPNVRADSTFKIWYDPTRVGRKETFLATLKMLEVTKNRTLMPVLYLFLHTSLMTSLFAEAHYPVKFLVAILGLTNSKKTSLALALLRLFNSDKNSPDISFTSTPGGIEVMMAKYADAILIIDDLMPATNKGRQNLVDNKFDDIARFSGDRTSKKRMTDFSPNNTKVDYPVRGCCVITGEQLHGVQSAESRVIAIRLQKTDVIGENLKYFQEDYRLLPTHQVDFLGYVALHYESIVSYIHEHLPIYRQAISVKLARLAEAFAVTAVTGDVVVSYIRERGFLSETDLAQFNQHLIESVKSVILANDHDFITQDPGVLCLLALSDSMTSRTVRVIQRSHYREKEEAVIEDENFYYVRTDTLFLVTKQYCAKMDIPIALVSPKAVIPALEQVGVLDFVKERSRKLPDNSADGRRYLYIKKDLMKEVLEQAEEEVN